ncbi:MAG: hypothetical protein ACRYG2_20495 [Janthinobacterium lividum]
MDRLTPLRVPLAVLALAALTLVAAARVVLGLSEVVTTGGSRAVAAARLAPNGSDAALTVLVGVLVASCFVAPEVPGRRRLAVWGAALTVISVVATLVALGLTDLAVAGWNLVWGVPDLAVPALAGAGLLVLSRPYAGDAPAPRATGQAEVPPVVDAPEVAAPDPELAPSWSQDVAAGAVWRTAGEAARGAPAQEWGTAGETTWLTPAPGSPPALPAGRDERADRSEQTRSDPL